MDNLDALEAELGCWIGHLLTTYLGLPLGVVNKFVAIWDNIEEKNAQKTDSLEKKLHLKGGRITLIESTLANLPLYQISLVQMSVVVTKRLEKLQRSFHWEGCP